MHNECVLQEKDFDSLKDDFDVLNISSEDVIGKNYKDLSDLITEQYIHLIELDNYENTFAKVRRRLQNTSNPYNMVRLVVL